MTAHWQGCGGEVGESVSFNTVVRHRDPATPYCSLEASSRWFKTSLKTCELVLLRCWWLLIIVILVNWCGGASYYRWCRNMHCLLKTSAGKAAIVIMLKEIVTFMTVRFQLFLQSTFKSQHFPSVKWLQCLFARWCPFSQRTAAQMKMNQERNLKQTKAKLWNLKAKLWNRKQSYEI